MKGDAEDLVITIKKKKTKERGIRQSELHPENQKVQSMCTPCFHLRNPNMDIYKGNLDKFAKTQR